MHIIMPCIEFAPFCAPGSIRLSEFASRFSKLGHRVTVITSALSDYQHGYPKKRALDDDLLRDVDPHVRILRTPPARDLPDLGFHCTKAVLDNRQRWLHLALQEILELASQETIDLIYTSSNPLSIHLLGLHLKSLLPIKWVAEFRDSWTNHGLRSWDSQHHFRADREIEGRVAALSDHIFHNTPSGMAEFLKVHPFASYKSRCVPNGFRETTSISDLNRSKQATPQILILYAGTILPPPQRGRIISRLKRKIKRKRFRIKPHCDQSGRSIIHLARGLQQALRIQPRLRSLLRIHIIGTTEGEVDHSKSISVAKAHGLTDILRLYPPKPRSELAGDMMKADAFLILQERAAKEAHLYVPAKTYEYIAYRKPILGLVSDRDCIHILRSTGLGELADPTSPKSIATAILAMCARIESRGTINPKADSAINSFHLSEIARQAADAFSSPAQKQEELHKG